MEGRAHSPRRRSYLGNERGIALVTVLLVLLVVSALSAAVLQLTVHNLDTSAYDTRRDQALQAAEAGLGAYTASLQTTTGAAICGPFNGTVTTQPSVSYSVTVVPFDANGMPVACSASTSPASLVATSAGTAGAPPMVVIRRIQTKITLAPLGGMDKAILSDQYLSIQNNLTVNGYGGNDADVYTNGNYTSSNNITVFGKVYAQGSASISNSGATYAGVWANGPVTLNNNVSVLSDVTSSTSSVSLANSASVLGNARAGTGISLQNQASIGGQQQPNSPQGPPPSVQLPQLKWDAAAQANWQAAGYSIQTFSDCNTAKTFIGGIAGGDYVVRISPACALSWTNNSTVNIRGNLAIVTDGSISTANNTTFNAVGGNWTLALMVPYPSAGSPNCTTWGNMSFSNSTSLNGLTTLVYSPCTVSFANNNANGWNGQLIGGVVSIANQMVLNYRPVLIPSMPVTGYSASHSYIREIK